MLTVTKNKRFQLSYENALASMPTTFTTDMMYNVMWRKYNTTIYIRSLISKQLNLDDRVELVDMQQQYICGTRLVNRKWRKV